ncbi:MAG: DnaD domain protein [Clostridia bacterium]|nr:DnaD domain protein [Clostridia bacterium]
MANEMRIRMPDGIVVDKKTCEKLICEPDGNAARLWLLLASAGDMGRDAAAARLSLPRSAVDAAFAALVRAGLCLGGEENAEPKAETPVTAKDVLVRRETDDYFNWLLSYAEQTLGRTLTPSDTVTLMRVCDRYGLMAETVPLLLRFCADKADPGGVTGRRATMYQVEKAAAVWEREGIDSPEKADAYIRRETECQTRVQEFLRDLGIFSTTPAVQKTVAAWLDTGLPTEVLQHACDLTVAKTGLLKWNYADSILRSWISKGLRTMADIQREEGPKKTKPAAPQKTGDELARRREIMRRNMERAGGGEDK